MPKQHLNIRIRGKVQGVFLRDSAREKAQDLGITGFIRNEPDGTVYLEVEGDAEQIKKFTSWLHTGPSRAFVEQVETAPGEHKGYTEFNVTYVD